eukprot:scaffold92094_cov55-Attheya_sp.AAC.5
MSHHKREEEESQAEACWESSSNYNNPTAPRSISTANHRNSNRNTQNHQGGRSIFGGSVRTNYPGESFISSTPKTSNFDTFLNNPQENTIHNHNPPQLPLQLGSSKFLKLKLKLKYKPKSSMLTNLFGPPQNQQQQQQQHEEEEEDPVLPTLEQMIHPPPLQREQEHAQQQHQQDEEFHDNTNENVNHDDPSHVFLQVSQEDPLRLSPPPPPPTEEERLQDRMSDLTHHATLFESPTKSSRTSAQEQPPMTPPIRRIYNSNSAPPPLSPMTPHDTTTTTTTTKRTTPYYKASSTTSRTRTKHPQALLSVPVLDHSAFATTPTPTASNGTSSLHKPESASSSSSSGGQENTTSHAQSFVLAVAFMAIWSPQNCMAPNLTQMADYFHFDPNQRDLFLGANIAFATGVLSLPVSALIGFVADVVPSRKQLFAATVLLGGIASICTGFSKTYSQLYFARFANGGCMSGSVPVAFSLLGDLFDTKDRNAASSGLTAMMGTGIIFGQVYSGVVGDTLGWQHPFRLSGVWTIVTSFFVMMFVQEPVRGGKEKVLQEMLARGTRYDRKLTLQGFLTAMTKNESNFILMGQGQEKGMSVPDATLLVFFFGVGCAAGGVLGGYWGQLTTQINRSYMPLFMAVTTFLGMFPFLGLLDGNFDRANTATIALSLCGGLIANLPSVNVRPCLINVNPPETRGAALTAANLIINFARGCGPSFITMMGGIWQVDRQYSFNVTLIVFWTIASFQLLFLARSLPKDQDAMEAELALYAETVLIQHRNANQGGDRSVTSGDNINDNDDLDTLADESIVSIDERATSFDANAARESLTFMSDALREIGDEWLHHHHHHNDDSDDDDEEGIKCSFGDRPNKNARHKKNHTKRSIFLEQQEQNPFHDRNKEMTWGIDPLQYSVAQQILEDENESNNSHGAISSTNSESDALLQTNTTNNNDDPPRDYNSMSFAPTNGTMYTI